MGAAGNGGRDFEMIDKLVVSVTLGPGRGQWFGGSREVTAIRKIAIVTGPKIRTMCILFNQLQRDQGALCSQVVRSFRQVSCPTVAARGTDPSRQRVDRDVMATATSVSALTDVGENRRQFSA